MTASAAGTGPGRDCFRPGHPAPRGTHGPEAGAAVVEFALVLVVLVLLIFGIAEFGRAYHADIQLTHAVREGARELAVTGDQAGAVVATRSAAGSLDPALLEITITACDPGEDAHVRARYPLTYSIPLYGSATLTLDSEAVMRCGG